MIMIITLTLSFLVALNFFLLFFSCNKSSKKEIVNKTQVRESIIARKYVTGKLSNSHLVTNQLPSAQLAPTGS